MEGDTHAGETPKRGRWAKGQSGNPAGRPAGARNQATLAREALLDAHSTELIEKALELALAGDVGALKLCLERLLPIRRERTIHLSVPGLEEDEALSRTTRALLKAVAEGEITPLEAESVGRLILVHNQVVAAVDHEKRLAALEAKVAGAAEENQ